MTTDYLLGMSDVKRDLTGQIKLNETLDEYYDMIVMMLLRQLIEQCSSCRHDVEYVQFQKLIIH